MYVHMNIIYWCCIVVVYIYIYISITVDFTGNCSKTGRMSENINGLGYNSGTFEVYWCG